VPGETDAGSWRKADGMTTEHAEIGPTAGTPHDGQRARAAAAAVEQNTSHLHLPVIGRVELPPTDQLAFMGGILVLAAVGVMELPVALVLTTGHLLAHNRHVQLLRDFGKGLEEA
jgi:hypothetical protein